MKKNHLRRIASSKLVWIFMWSILTTAPQVFAHRYHDHERSADETILEVSFASSGGVVIAGELSFPEAGGPYCCVILAGGTLSHTRDGEFLHPQAPKRDALKRLSDRLIEAGYATLRFDKRGYGKSSQPQNPASYQDQADDLKAAMLFARHRADILTVLVAGESAGAYLACLAAKDKVHADGYMFLGGLSSSSPELYAYNFGRLKEWAEQSEANMDWAKRHAFHDLRLGYGYQDMFQAARDGLKSFTFSLDGQDWRMPLERKREELDNEPGELYQYILKPALAIQGQLDMNVPPGDNRRAVERMKKAGSLDAAAVDVPNCDHNFQMSPETFDERIKERFSFASLRNPYNEAFYGEILHWLADRFPAEAGLDNQTQAWGGVRVIDDITDPRECPGVETLEGRIGPLMKAEESQCHYIEMIPGQYTPEHAHSTESIIYTVKGQWVLCRAGHRRLMKPGTLFHFARNIPTGYEVPFDEPSYILIFKSHRSDWSDDEFLDYLRRLKGDLESQNKEGSPFFLRELPADHPARQFARTVNPEWEKTLE
ncbi:MAG: alpha/beta fold hydrolase [Candidatus Omnitrophica bacterium]|nr:alpha/beta fold hydrolase [Candidatus Omnitrophota bacterium]